MRKPESNAPAENRERKSAFFHSWIERLQSLNTLGETKVVLDQLADPPSEVLQAVEKPQEDPYAQDREYLGLQPFDPEALGRQRILAVRKSADQRILELREKQLNENVYVNNWEQEQAEKFYSAYEKQRSPINTARQMALIIQLTANGVSHPAATVRMLEMHHLRIRFFDLTLKEDGTIRENDLKPAEESILRAHQELSESDNIQFLRESGDFLAAQPRYKWLKGEQLSPYANSGENKRLAVTLKRISSIPDEQWQQVTQQMDKYPFLSERKGTRDLRIQDSIDPLMDIMLNGGLTQEQVAAADVALRICTLTDDRRGRDHEVIRTGDIRFLTENRERLNDELAVIEALVHERPTRVGSRISSSDIFKGLRELHREGHLHKLATLLRSGKTLGKIDSIFGYNFSLHYMKDVEEAKQSIDAASNSHTVQENQEQAYLSLLTSVFADRERRAWSAHDISQIHITEHLFKPENINIFFTVAELVKITTPVDQRKKVLSSVLEPAMHHGFNVETWNLTQLVNSADLTKLPEEDRTLWQFWKECSQNRNIDLRLIGDFLIIHKSELHQQRLIQTTFDPELFNKLVVFIQNLNPRYVEQSSGNSRDLHGNAAEFILQPENCPEEWKGLAQYSSGDSYLRQVIIYAITEKQSEWHLYVVNGKPQSLLFERILQSMETDYCKQLINKEGVDNFTETQQSFWKTWLGLSGELQHKITGEFKEVGSLTPEFIDRIKLVKQLSERVAQSTSKEMRKFQDQILSQLLDTDNPLESLEEIIEIFEKNNLPDVGKIYRVFELIHKHVDSQGVSGFQRKLDYQGSRANLSPTLLRSSERVRYAIIYRDLLEIHIESNNPSLRAYLRLLQDGESLLRQLEESEAETIDANQEIQLVSWLDKLDTLFSTSQLGKKSERKLDKKTDLAQRITHLREALQVKDGQSINDRIVEMFARPLGYRNIEEVLNRMDQAQADATQRNADYYRDVNGRFIFNAGDLIKGFDPKFIGPILYNGATAPEYLGGNAGEDKTPFDTDTSMVVQSDVDAGTQAVIDNSIAKSYTAENGLLMVIRNRGQFQLTSTSEPFTPSRNHYELMWSAVADTRDPSTGAVIDRRHYGIRTGIPSTEIDAFVAMPELADKPIEVQRIGFLIGLSDKYIPIIDSRTGAYLTTPEFYEQNKVDVESIRKLLASGEYTNLGLIEELKSSEYMRKLYDGPAYVAEGYSLEQHTLMVMRQFDRYFAMKPNMLLSADQFKVLLSLHDIGKPIAQEVEGSTVNQHEYTSRIVPQILLKMGWEQRSIDLVIAIAKQDHVGKYLKGEVSLQDTSEQIRQMAQELSVPIDQLFETITVYYMVDASAYTEDAGGIASLDNIFKIDRAKGSESGNIDFSDDYKVYYDALLGELI